ncbi:MAG: IS200/IS605 family transposase [Bacteroidota bacterium]
MGNSYISCYVHYVFSVKNREPRLTPAIRERLFPYMGGICKENDLKLRKAGGVEDHVHLLVSLPATITLAKAVQYIKGGSSRWIHETFEDLADFAWQEGYGAFTIGVSQIEQTKRSLKTRKSITGKSRSGRSLLSFWTIMGLRLRRSICCEKLESHSRPTACFQKSCVFSDSH